VERLVGHEGRLHLDLRVGGLEVGGHLADVVLGVGRLLHEQRGDLAFTAALVGVALSTATAADVAAGEEARARCRDGQAQEVAARQCANLVGHPRSLFSHFIS
jgi:hypothetical protein